MKDLGEAGNRARAELTELMLERAHAVADSHQLRHAYENGLSTTEVKTTRRIEGGKWAVKVSVTFEGVC